MFFFKTRLFLVVVSLAVSAVSQVLKVFPSVKVAT